MDSLPVVLSLAVVERPAGSLAALDEAALRLPAVTPTSRKPLPGGRDDEGSKMLRARVNHVFAQGLGNAVRRRTAQPERLESLSRWLWAWVR
jgi:hypothetical protein